MTDLWTPSDDLLLNDPDACEQIAEAEPPVDVPLDMPDDKLDPGDEDGNADDDDDEQRAGGGPGELGPAPEGTFS